MKIHNLIENAYKVLDGAELGRREAVELAEQISGSDLLDLISLAHKVQLKYAPRLEACSIISAKSGKCGENCRFCAQSCCHNTAIETYELLEPATVIAAARQVYRQGIRTFGYVTSGRGWLIPDKEFQRILTTLDCLHAEFPDLKLCVSLGILSEACRRWGAG